ncbi:Lrp/AsnC family transcriptional regulator [Streptomyces hyderabadensis]|uniref:Lrp/AsnC family transcriptional regulator n=1 Tax=Streptomyces hyderabadensis TaxID=598549 RepID=UPI001CEFD136|nr:Lrp/AsnC family transcriptional regulator [Streptomyces hyderabadensis]
MNAVTPPGHGAPVSPGPLDPLDLRLLQALEFDGRAPFSRIAQVLGVSDQTAARRVRRLRTTANLRITGMIDDSRLGRDTWIVRLGCGPGRSARLAATLADRHDTHYVDIAAGGTEVICAVTPRSRPERDDLLLERFQRTPHINTVSTHCVLHTYYGNSLRWLRKISALEPEQERALRTPAPSPGPAAAPDAADQAVLELLHTDGRATLTELQRATGLSETAVRKRLDRLRATGVLHIAVEYDHEPLGLDVEALVWLSVAPHALAEAGRVLATRPEVRFAAAVTGSTNLVLSVLCRNARQLHAFLSEQVGALTGVRTAETVLTLRRVKTLTVG